MIVTLSRWLAVVVLVLGILLRFLHLDADPYYYEWIGYITDEGRWIAHARGLALFGPTFDIGWSLHLTLAPLYQLASYLIFSLSTVSLTTSRLLSAVAGSGLLVTFWLLMRRVASPSALLVGLTLLALEIALLGLSRLAIPEMVVMFLHLLVFALIVAAPTSSGRLALSGFLQAVAVGMKATALPALAIFLVVILAQPPAPGDRGRLKSIALFGAGFGGPIAVVALTWSLCCYPRGIDLDTLETIRLFVRPTSAYGAFAFFFDNTLAPIMNTWAVVLWLGLVGWISSDDVDLRLRRYLRSATIWWAMYSVLMLGLQYFPDRYKIHVFVPVAVCIAAGLTLLERVGLAGVEAKLARGRGIAGMLHLGVVAFPTAVFFAPLLGAGLGWALESPPRLRFKLLCVSASLALTTWILHDRRRQGRSMAFFVTFPVITAIAWWSLRATSLGGIPFWPDTSFSIYALWWAPFLLATALATALTNWCVRRAGAIGTTYLVAAVAIVCVVLSVINIAPGYVYPHYSIREASHGLGRLLSDYGGVVSTLKAEGLFNENTLRYVTILGDPDWRVIRPEVLVAVFDSRDNEKILEREYCLIEHYGLYVSPEFFRSHSELLLSPDTLVSARVYRRNVTGCPRRVSPGAVLRERPSSQSVTLRHVRPNG